MIEGEDESKVVALNASAGTSIGLAYVIELWNLPRTSAERVIGRASSILVARAIFAAAQTEHLGRRVVLRRGGRVIAESG